LRWSAVTLLINELTQSVRPVCGGKLESKVVVSKVIVSGLKTSKKMSSPLTAINPLILTSKFFGFSLCTIDGKSWAPKYHKIDIAAIFFTLLMTVVLNAIYWTTFFSDTYDEFRSVILELSLPLLINIDYLINACAIVWFFVKRRKIAKLLKKMNAIDEKFSLDLNFTFDYKREKIKVGIYVVAALMSVTLMNIVDIAVVRTQEIPINPQDFVFIFWSFYAQVVQHLHQVIGMAAIKSRLAALGHLVKTTDNFDIKKFSRIHLGCIDAIAIFNDIFPPIMMLYFGDMFCWVCVLIFDMATVPKSTVMDFVNSVVMNAPHAIYFMGILFVIIRTAEGVKGEVRRLVVVLCQKMNACEKKEEREEVTQLLHQIVNIPVDFSSGLIDYDWKLMFKVWNQCENFIIIHHHSFFHHHRHHFSLLSSFLIIIINL
jgi:hypothetical protein